MKTSTSADGVSQVYLCDKCGREQFAFNEDQEHGLMPEEAEGIGWAETDGELLCPICRSVM